MVTGLIAGRLWYLSRIPIVDEYGKPAMLKIVAGRRPMMLIIESGALYMIIQLIFVVLVAIQNSAEALLSYAGTQIYVSPGRFWFVVRLIIRMSSGYRVRINYHSCWTRHLA
jgi:hypothetical protein